MVSTEVSPLKNVISKKMPKAILMDEGDLQVLPVSLVVYMQQGYVTVLLINQADKRYKRAIRIFLPICAYAYMLYLYDKII